MTHYKPETSLSHPTSVDFVHTERFHGVPGEEVTAQEVVETRRFHGNFHETDTRNWRRLNAVLGTAAVSAIVVAGSYGLGKFSERWLGDDPTEMQSENGSEPIESGLTTAELIENEAVSYFDGGYALDVEGNKYIPADTAELFEE